MTFNIYISCPTTAFFFVAFRLNNPIYFCISISFRPHSPPGCFQTAYVDKGIPRYDGTTSAACPTGPPKGAEWFNVKVTVSTATPAGEVKVYLDGALVTSFNPRYPIKRRGGILVANGYQNVIHFRNFQLL